MAGVWSMTQNGVTVFLPLYLYFIMDASPALIGFALFSIQIGAIFAGPMAGAWSDQIGARKVVLCALVASTLLLLILPFFNNVYIFIGIVWCREYLCPNRSLMYLNCIIPEIEIHLEMELFLLKSIFQNLGILKYKF